MMVDDISAQYDDAIRKSANYWAGRLGVLADQADMIAVAGENRYLNGVRVPSSAEVMHEMRDVIREMQRALR